MADDYTKQLLDLEHMSDRITELEQSAHGREVAALEAKIADLEQKLAALTTGDVVKCKSCKKWAIKYTDKKITKS